MSHHVIGIDIGKRKLRAVWLRDRERGRIKSKSVGNDPQGMETLLRWALQHTKAAPESLHFAMEATNVYHEALAERLYEAGARVSVLNPAQVHYFAKSQGVHTKTDAHDARMLALYACERRPEAWQPQPPEVRELRALLRRIEALRADLGRERNRLDSARQADHPELIRSHESLMREFERELERLLREIDDHIDRHPQLREDRALLETVPGIGRRLSAEFTALFATRAFRSATQAAAFLGLVPRQRQSGDSLCQPARMTKAGEARLRALLYYPALAAVRCNPSVRTLYQRLRSRGKTRMAAIGAAMRKLVHIAFGVTKNQQPFNPDAA